MTPRERSILSLAGYGHFMSHFNMLAFPALLLPLSGRLHMDMADTLALSFWMYLLFGITALPWGIAADRFGAKPLLFLFHLGAGISGLSAAFLIDSPTGLLLALACLGLFSGIYHPAGLGWISREVDRTSYGLALNGMCGNLGLAMSPLITGLVNWLWGIQAAYLVVGALNLAGVLLFIGTPQAKAAHSGRSTKKETSYSLAPFCILLVAMMLSGFVYRGTSVTLPAYFELKNVDLFTQLAEGLSFLSQNVTATTTTSFIYLMGMVGQYVGGRVGEKIDLGLGYFLFHLITIPPALFMAITSNVPLIFLAVIHSFFLLGMQPIENTLVARLTPKNLHHSAYGMKFVFTFGVGALAVKMVGAVRTSWSLEAVFPSLAMVSLMLVSVIVLLRIHLKRRQQLA